MSQIDPNIFLSAINAECYVVVEMIDTEIIKIVSVHSSSASAHEHALMTLNLKVLGPVPYFKNTFSEPSPLKIDPLLLDSPQIGRPRFNPKPFQQNPFTPNPFDPDPFNSDPFSSNSQTPNPKNKWTT